MNNDTTDYRTYLNPCIDFIRLIYNLPEKINSGYISILIDVSFRMLPFNVHGIFLHEREYLRDILAELNEYYPMDIKYSFDGDTLFIPLYDKTANLSSLPDIEGFKDIFNGAMENYNNRIKRIAEELYRYSKRCGIELLPSEQIRTSAMDFLFHGKDKLRKRFISFFTTKHDWLKLTATDAVQILLMEVGKDRFDALNKNGLTAKHLWNDLRAVEVIGGIVADVKDATLNYAAKGATPKADVLNEWNSFK